MESQDKHEIKHPHHLHLDIHGNIKQKLKYFIEIKKNTEYYILRCIWLWEEYYCKTIYTGYIP